MASRLVRVTAIAGGVAAIAGLGIGFAAGKPVDPKDILPARKLPADLCSRLGDVSTLLPKATTGTPAPKLTQTGSAAVRCSAKADTSTQPTHTAAELIITITPYAGKDEGAGQPPFKPDAVARQAFDRKALKVVPDRPLTKMDARQNPGGQNWSRQSWAAAFAGAAAGHLEDEHGSVHPGAGGRQRWSVRRTRALLTSR